MTLTPEQQQMFNSILDLVYCYRRERDKDKADHIQYLIEAEKNKFMKSMPSFRDYIRFWQTQLRYLNNQIPTSPSW